VEANAELRAEYETAQKEILLLGELYRRQQEILSGFDSNRYIEHEMEDLRLTYEDEIKSMFCSNLSTRGITHKKCT
jgi:hypothetical protein